MVKYWFFLIPAILLCLIPTEKIDDVTKKWIPDEKKRAKCFLAFLIAMAVFYTILLLLVSKNIPWVIRIPLSSFPLVSVGIGILIGRFWNKISTERQPFGAFSVIHSIAKRF